MAVTDRDREGGKGLPPNDRPSKRRKRAKARDTLLGARGDTARWYTLDGKELARAVNNIADVLYRDQQSRRTRYKLNQSLFEGFPMTAYTAEGYTRLPADGVYDDPDPRRLIRSAVQTARAEIYSKQKPKGQAQTSGADWKTRRKAQKLDRLHEGILNQRQGGYPNVWALMWDRGAEAATQGTGPVKVVLDVEAEQVVHEEVPCCELYYDPCEGKNPRTLTQLSPIDTDVAIGKFCQKEGDDGGNLRRRLAIESAQPFERGDSARTPKTTRPVRMTEIWRLPDGPTRPGRRAVVIGDEVMDESEWVAPAFPFVFLHWERHRNSPWGQGIAQEGERAAMNANDLHDRLLSRQRIAAGKRTYYTAAVGIDVELLKGNDEETLIPVPAGAPFPTSDVSPPFGPAEVQFAEMEVRNFWDSTGISQVSAAARREQGVDSGAAIRTLNDTKAGRQLDKAQNFEQAFVDLAYQHLYRARELAAINPKAVLRYPGGRVLRDVAVADCLIDDKDFSWNIAPAANLPNDPAGRQSLVGELYASQIISQETYKQLLNWPDLEKELNVSSVEQEYIDSLIDKYLDADPDKWQAGDYESPEGFLLDKNTALLRVSAAYFQAKIDKAPTFNTDLLRRYAQELDVLIQRAMSAQAAAQAPPPGMPPGPGGPMLPAPIPGPGLPAGPPAPPMLGP
jgi:hypothetical protein